MGTEDFRAGMRRLAGAVNIITTIDGEGRRCGITATAVNSLSTDPPSLIACVNKATSVGQVAPAARIFCVNVLASEQQQLADVFAGRTDLARDDRFQKGNWARLQTGAPVLADARASFDCELVEAIDYATHLILIGRVVATRLGSMPDMPLLYGDGSYLAAIEPALSSGRTHS